MRFVVHGLAQPGGSKRGFARKRADGSTFVSVVDANPRAAAWKQEVAHAARNALGDCTPFQGPLAFSCTFHVPRPSGHYGSGRNAGIVRASAPVYPTGRPDVLKLARAVEDALTAGGLWRDDAQVVEEHLRKVYTEAGPYVEIEVLALDDSETHRTPQRPLAAANAPLFGAMEG